MLFPQGKTVHKDLSTYYTRSRMLIRDLEDHRFTGYMTVSFWEYEGYLLFDTGRIIQAYVDTVESVLYGVEAVRAIHNHLGDKDGSISVYSLEQELIAVISALHFTRELSSGKKPETQNYADTIDQALASGEAGYMVFRFNQNGGDAAVYFSSGNVVGCTIRSGTGRTVTDTRTGHLFQRLIKLVDKVETDHQLLYCDTIAAYEESEQIALWFDFFDFMFLMGKLHDHIRPFFYHYCSASMVEEFIAQSLQFLRDDYGFDSVAYQNGKFEKFKHYDIAKFKELYIEIIQDVIAKINDMQPVDMPAFKLCLLPFNARYQRFIEQYELTELLQKITIR